MVYKLTGSERRTQSANLIKREKAELFREDMPDEFRGNVNFGDLFSHNSALWIRCSDLDSL